MLWWGSITRRLGPWIGRTVNISYRQIPTESSVMETLSSSMVSSLFSRPRDEDRSWISHPSSTCSTRERRDQAPASSPRTTPASLRPVGAPALELPWMQAHLLTVPPCTRGLTRSRERPGSRSWQIPRSFWNPQGSTIITTAPHKSLKNWTG